MFGGSNYDMMRITTDTMTGEYSRIEHTNKKARIVKNKDDTFWGRLKKRFQKKK